MLQSNIKNYFLFIQSLNLIENNKSNSPDAEFRTKFQKQVVRRDKLRYEKLSEMREMGL